MLEGFAVDEIISLITALGIPGLVVMLWYDYTRRTDKANAEHCAMIDRVLTQYRDDVSQIRKMYENNAHLVEDYNKAMTRFERLFSEVINIVSLNTQTQTSLVDAINASLRSKTP